MKRGYWKRIFSGFLAVALMLGYLPTAALAEESSGLCKHHPTHSDCGFVEGFAGSPCTHEHIQECYTEVTQCVHVHDCCSYVAAVEKQACACEPDENGNIIHAEGCGYQETVAEVPCDHVCSEDSGCVVRTLSCQHIHDANCGYSPAVKASPCAFACEECAKAEADAAVVAEIKTLIEALSAVDEVKAMDQEGQQAAYTQVQAAYEAYGKLTTDQQLQLPNADTVFESLFDYFNTLTNTLLTADEKSGTGTPDGTLPILTSLTVSANTVTVPGSVEVIAGASDDVSGVSSMQVIFTCSETGKSIYVRLSDQYYDEETGQYMKYADGKFHGKLEIDQYVGSGVFIVDELYLDDSAGNTVHYLDAPSGGNDPDFQPIPEFAKEIQITVTNTGADITTSTNKESFIQEVQSATNDAYITADYSSNTNLSGDVFTAIAGTNKTLDLTSEGVTWRFEGSDITNTVKPIDLDVQIMQVDQDSSTEGEAIEAKLGNNPAVVMKFAENGVLPGKATIQVKVDYAMRQYLGSGKDLCVYFYNNQTGELELIAGGLQVVNDTYVEFAITHCCAYVLTRDLSTASVKSGICGDNLNWIFDEESRTLTLSGTGSMCDYSTENSAPWSAYSANIRQIVLPEELTGIGSYAFANCTALASVTLPGESIHLRTGAFSGCTNLKEITFKGGIVHPIASDIFSDVTATVYYPAGYWWKESDQKAFGENLTWVEYGKDAVMLTMDAPSIRVGDTATTTVTVHPHDATANCTFAVSDPKILEIVSHDAKTVNIKGLKLGRATLTVADQNTGLSVSQEICVYDTTEITCPYEERILIDAESVIKEYTFTPEASGEYIVMTTDVNSPGWDGCGCSVTLDGEYLEGLSYIWGDGIIQRVVYLDAEKTYLVRAEYRHAELGKTAKFQLIKASDTVESVNIIPDVIECELSGVVGHIEWVNAVINPSTAYSELKWSSSNPEVAEITLTNSSECGFIAKKPGEAEITVTCGRKSDAVKVIVHEAQTLELNKTVELKNYSSTHFGYRTVQFVPTEFGRYVFTITGNNLQPHDASFGNYSTSYPVGYSYSENSILLLRYLEAGEICSIKIHTKTMDGTRTITVRKATDTVTGMNVVCMYNTPDRVAMGVHFTPETAAEEVVKWEISDPSLLGQSEEDGSPHNNYAYFTPYGTGEVTVTATSKSGLVDSCTILVGKCMQGHDYTPWETTVDGVGVPTGNEHRYCTRCDIMEIRKVRPTEDVPAVNRLDLNGSALTNQSTVWIDGLPYPVEQDANGSYVEIPDGAGSILVTYSYHVGDSADVHTQYPTGITAYRIVQTESGASVERLPALDNILQYSGCSIRITGKRGIRMITSVNQSKKAALTSGGLEGFKLLEYGTALCWASDLDGGKSLTLGKPYTRSNFAYKKGVSDPVFAYSGDLVQYTNVLVGFTNDECRADIAMRPYMILEDAQGESFTLYGGTIFRSIGYIAWQNRNVFAPGTASYAYVWDIIHHVYGSKYDADYRG